jgi:hypothetical protein
VLLFNNFADGIARAAVPMAAGLTLLWLENPAQFTIR